MSTRAKRTGGALALALALLPGLALAGEALVVLSSELGPYKALEKGFTQTFAQPSKTVSLPAGAEALPAAVGQASLVLAVGPDAAKALAPLKPAAPLLAALVPSVEKVAPGMRVVAVPMFVPAPRQVRAIAATLPAARTLGMLYDPALSKALAGECEAAASAAGLKLVLEPVASRKDVALAARGLLGRVDALWLVPDTTVVSAESFKFIVQESFAAKVPVIGFSEGMAKAGALMAVQADYEEMGRKAALAARKILAGDKSGAEGPDGTLYLNAKSADLLGVTLSPALKTQAAAVFQ